jgi:hypothetical protein
MDSTDCRNNATTCIEMANRAAEQREQSALFDLARSWVKLAEELENDPALTRPCEYCNPCIGCALIWPIGHIYEGRQNDG